VQKFYLGCDVSKGYSDFVIIDENLNCVEENFQLDDTALGHAELRHRIAQLFEKYPLAILYTAVESTGGYENNWYGFLLKLQEDYNLHAARVNPNGIAHDNKAGMIRNLTDKISARSVAEYQVRHPEKIPYGQTNPHASLKKVWVHLRLLKKQRGDHLNELESLLYCGNPEILQYCRHKIPKWVMKLLTKYPTAALLSRARVKSVAAIPFLKKQLAPELIKHAKASTAESSDETTAFLIISTVSQLVHLDKSIELYEKRLETMCRWPEVDLLMTISGVGRMTAIVLMLYIEDIQRFESAKKLASFLGVHPEYRLSGDGTKKGSYRMSKKGQKAPRAMLYMSVLAGLSKRSRNPIVRKIYDDKRAQGMAPKAAIGVCIHKLVRIAYGVLASKTAFNPMVDDLNRQKSSPAGKNAVMGKERRYQEYDVKAPISRRQSKKRMEQAKSQDRQAVECGIRGRAPRASQ
jgi:transposase